MSKYTIFHIPLLSFYSTDLYRDMAFNKKGIGFGYLFLLLAVCWLILVIAADSYISESLDKYAPALINQVPVITITDGQASIEESQPYYIDDPESGAPIAVIDTTGTINSLDDTEAVVLLTRTHAIFEKNQFETRSFDLREVGDFVIDRNLLEGLVDATKTYTPFVIYPIALAGSYFYRIIQMLIYAAIGLIFVSICKAKLDYDQLLRLSVVAVTPCILINTLLMVIGAKLPMAGFMFFALAMIYLYLGVKATTHVVQDEVADQ